MSLISIKDFQKEDILNLCALAKGQIRRRRSLSSRYPYIMASLFYEPSSRTSNRFKSAMFKLGGDVIGFDNAKTSSVKKSESLRDTIHTFCQYADIIVLRHPNEGAAKFADSISSVPVINAGDGSNEHPTQTLLDIFTIYDVFSKRENYPAEQIFNNLHVGVANDLRYSRTIHSLIEALKILGAKVSSWSPAPEIDMDWPHVSKVETLEELLSISNVVYMTRLQKERFVDETLYEQVRGRGVINRDLLESLKNKPYIMHPLPRNEEIHPDVDTLPQAIYFYQMYCGLIMSEVILLENLL